MRFPLVPVLWAISLAQLVTCLLAGNEAYKLEIEPDIEGGTELEVFASGFNKGKIPILRAIAYPEDGLLRIAEAWTGHDETPVKLFTSQIVSAIWTESGHSKASLKKIQIDDVTNIKTVAAARIARDEQGKEKTPFDITKANAKGWEAMLKSPFGKVAERIAKDMSKEVSRVSLGNYYIIGKYGKREDTLGFDLT
ncbi:hypothetical protein CDEST_10345 [Colletotrichum destructivum]|uniref:Uncharacterized protein n=1 Tax=Colletotrichum destructivum TaxID=34406 RepID=A0AAX4IQJ7_9PEZI|nr:hypothetical protein CDEST_10345 [Colletotrichum destructivum]